MGNIASYFYVNESNPAEREAVDKVEESGERQKVYLRISSRGGR